MKDETQASSLVKIIQARTHYPVYELALPLVSVRSNKLKKLSLDDVILTGFDALELVLIDHDAICANVQLRQTGNAHGADIVYLHKNTIKPHDSKKYKTLKISFGTIQSKELEVGHAVDITHIDFKKVRLVLEAKTIAEGSLVKVDEEIAIQIRKVI